MNRLSLLLLLTCLTASCSSGGSGSDPKPSPVPDKNKFQDEVETKDLIDPISNEVVAHFDFTWRKYINRTFSDPEPISEVLLDIRTNKAFPLGFDYQVEAISTSSIHQYSHKGNSQGLSAGETLNVGVIAEQVASLVFSRFNIEIIEDELHSSYFQDSDFLSLLQQSSSSARNTATTIDTPVVQSCSKYPLNIQASYPSQLSCGLPGVTTFGIMNDLNNFWGSSTNACVCGADAYLSQNCANNAFVLANPAGVGYIYYDPNMLSKLDQQGGVLGAAWFIAHEMGHQVQIRTGMPMAIAIQRELGADCLAGYFVSWLACNGTVNLNQVQTALNSVCSTGDPIDTPWFHPNAHGNCQDRINATIRGFNVYTDGLSPTSSCIF